MNSAHQHSRIIYEIKVQGELDRSWESFFEDLAVMPGQTNEQSPPTTILVGPVIDQVALRGLLCKLWDLNLTLVSVRQLKPDFTIEKSNDREKSIRDGNGSD